MFHLFLFDDAEDRFKHSAERHAVSQARSSQQFCKKCVPLSRIPQAVSRHVTRSDWFYVWPVLIILKTDNCEWLAADNYCRECQ